MQFVSVQERKFVPLEEENIGRTKNSSASWPTPYLVMLQVLFGFANEECFLMEIVPKYTRMESLKGSIVPWVIYAS